MPGLVEMKRNAREIKGRKRKGTKYENKRGEKKYRQMNTDNNRN